MRDIGSGISLRGRRALFLTGRFELSHAAYSQYVTYSEYADGGRSVKVRR